MAGWRRVELPVYGVTSRCIDHYATTPKKWHGRRESHPHKAVLETAALLIYHVRKLARDGKLSLNPCLAESSPVQGARTGSLCRFASLLWSGSSVTVSSLFSRPKAGNQPRLPRRAKIAKNLALNNSYSYVRGRSRHYNYYNSIITFS